jgi:hypothetical protein
MRTAEVLPLQKGICIAGEVAIGEEKQSHYIERQNIVSRRAGI